MGYPENDRLRSQHIPIGLLALHGEQSPGSGDALEFVLPSIIEGQARSSHEKRDGTRNHKLSCAGIVEHSRRDVDADSHDVAFSKLDLTGVQPGPNLDAQGVQGVS